jgi:hypothetical protein
VFQKSYRQLQVLAAGNHLYGMTAAPRDAIYQELWVGPHDGTGPATILRVTVPSSGKVVEIEQQAHEMMVAIRTCCWATDVCEIGGGADMWEISTTQPPGTICKCCGLEYQAAVCETKVLR